MPAYHQLTWGNFFPSLLDDFIRRQGCVEAAEVEPAIAAAEPFDLQMEYVL